MTSLSFGIVLIIIFLVIILIQLQDLKEEIKSNL
jgi:hypothetical protein